MLIYFSCDAEDGSISLSSQMQGKDGTHIDLNSTLPADTDFGNIPYTEMLSAERGTIFVDDQTGKGEILRPNDPRLNPAFTPRGARNAL